MLDVNETKSEMSAGNEASSRLREILAFNRSSGRGGTYAVCSAHHAVVSAGIQQALTNGSLFHIESTSSQVNQFGGYTGATPKQFADSIRKAARKSGLPEKHVLLGGDHLGPFPWLPHWFRPA